MNKQVVYILWIAGCLAFGMTFTFMDRYLSAAVAGITMFFLIMQYGISYEKSKRIESLKEENSRLLNRLADYELPD